MKTGAEKQNILPDDKLIREKIIAARGQGEGAEDAFLFLTGQYQSLLNDRTFRFSENVDEDGKNDLKQEALLAFFRAIQTYDVSQDKVTFGLYAKECITNALISHVKRMQRQIDWNADPLSEEDDFICSDEAGPEEDLIVRENIVLLKRRIAAELSPFENNIWNKYVAGFKAGQIAAQEGIDKKSVENAIYRIRRKLRQVLKNQYPGKSTTHRLGSEEP